MSESNEQQQNPKHYFHVSNMYIVCNRRTEPKVPCRWTRRNVLPASRTAAFSVLLELAKLILAHPDQVGELAGFHLLYLSCILS